MSLLTLHSLYEAVYVHNAPTLLNQSGEMLHEVEHMDEDRTGGRCVRCVDLPATVRAL